MKTIYLTLQIIIFSLLCTFHSEAAIPKLSWHKGQVTFWNNDVLSGDVSFNWLADMVMVRQADGRTATFSANQVLKFGWYDYAQQKYRSFQSIEGDQVNSKNFAGRAFYELCMDGALTVVRRLRQPHGLFKRAFGHPSYYTDQPLIAQNPDHFDYYIQDEEHLLALNRFYTDVYIPLMNTYDQKLKDFAAVHNINTRTTIGRLIMVDHYNFLVQQDARTASAKSRASAPN